MLRFAATPGHPGRSGIISQLNAFLDPELWQAVHTKKVQGRYIKPVNTTVEAFSRESGIRIVLHFVPQRNADAATATEAVWPLANTSVEKISLIYGIHQIEEAFGEANNSLTKNPFTFIFDDKEIHILPVAEAVKWWDENIIPTITKSQHKQ